MNSAVVLFKPVRLAYVTLKLTTAEVILTFPLKQLYRNRFPKYLSKNFNFPIGNNIDAINSDCALIILFSFLQNKC